MHNKKKNEKDILNILIKLNIIKYIINNNNKYTIIINLFKKDKIIFKIKNLFKYSNLYKIKLKNIKKINKKNKILIISSNKGVIDNFEAFKKKEGGIIIACLWN